MDDTEKKIEKLCKELSELRDLCKSSITRTWSENEWTEAKISAKELVFEIKTLASQKISELEKEQNELKNRYPKFSQRIIYKLLGVPEDVIVAEKRYNEIFSEIEKFKIYLK